MEGSSKIDFDAYLARISIVRGYSFWLCREGLDLLQTRHLWNVPFENLDIHWKRPIVLDVANLYEKIVVNKHGGFCYELNGLFEQLLRSMGFQTKLISARPYSDKKGFGPEFDHAAIIVSIGAKDYLVDVGFGDFAAASLGITDGGEQVDREGTFRIKSVEDGSFVVEKKHGDEWRPEYMFSTLCRDLAEFAGMCDFQQYSPESHFTKRKICSVMTIEGRKTLTDTKFIVTSNGSRTETEVGSEQEFNIILMREFGIRRNN